MLAWILAAEAQEPTEASWAGPAHLRTCPAAERVLPGDLAGVLSAVVVVRHADGAGSGVLVSPDGFVVTAAHVIEDAEQVEVSLDQGPTLPAEVLRVDPVHDLALLHIPGSGYACLPGGATPAVGSEVYVIGSPIHPDLGASVTRGVVSGVRVVEGAPLLQTDASINAGNSGGPMVDLGGRVVGIVQFKLFGEAVEGIGFGYQWSGAMDALDLEWAEASDQDLQALSGERTVRAPAPGTVADLPTAYLPTTSASPAGFDEGLLAGGGAIAALGWLAVGASTVWYFSSPEGSTTTWRAAQAVNTVGWVAALGGSGMIVAGTVSADGAGLRLGGRW